MKEKKSFNKSVKQIMIKKLTSAALAVATIFGLMCSNPMYAEAASPSVTYIAHCQDIGWAGWVSNGQTAGTTGQNRQMEAIQIALANVSGGVTYRAHCQDIGWTGWVSNGQTAGTTGQARQMEAIQIKLSGNAANNYNIQYRVHCQDIGWTGWVSNGQTAGTTGQNRQMEAIQIKLVAKTGGSSNQVSGTATPLNSNQGINICFNATYYANTYADLKAAFGYDYGRLLSHWQNNGIREGRSASPVFDPKYYLQANPDVARVFGSQNYAGAYSHFLNNGCNEGRVSSQYYQGSYYRARYSDLSSMSYYNLASHYLNHGINEGRLANSAGKKPGNMTPSGSNVPNTPSGYAQKMNAFINDARWKNGAAWNASKTPVLSTYGSTGCCAYTADFAKYVFNANGPRDGAVFYNPSEIRAGDIIYVSGGSHWFVVLERNGNSLRTAEGNWGSKVVISNTAYSVNGNTLMRNGSKFRTFQCGYHFQ